MTATATKTCATCGQDLPLTAFSTRSNGKDSRRWPRPSCRSCINTAGRSNTAERARRNAAKRAARAAVQPETVIDFDTVPDYKLREEWTHFHALGVPDEQIARQLGYTQVDSMHRALTRHGIRTTAPTTAHPTQEAA